MNHVEWLERNIEKARQAVIGSLKKTNIPIAEREDILLLAIERFLTCVPTKPIENPRAYLIHISKMVYFDLNKRKNYKLFPQLDGDGLEPTRNETKYDEIEFQILIDSLDFTKEELDYIKRRLSGDYTLKDSAEKSHFFRVKMRIREKLNAIR